MTRPLSAKALDQLFLTARSHNGWQDKTVPDETLRRLYDLLKMAPTCANGQHGRFVFVRTPAAKERLKPCLSPGNVEKTMAAPVTVIVAHDLEFHEKLPRLFPHVDARAWYTGNRPLIQETAFRGGAMQGAYLILAARSLGLDCGPMSGFDNAKVDAAFFPDGRIKSNFLVNLGYGDPKALFPRSPRFEFDEACRIE